MKGQLAEPPPIPKNKHTPHPAFQIEAKMGIRLAHACARASIGWWVHLGVEGKGNILIPPTAHPKMPPRRSISSQRKNSHQSYNLALHT